MYKKLIISFGITGLLLTASAFIFGSQINAKLMAYPGDLDILFGTILIYGCVLSAALSFWAQKYDSTKEPMPYLSLIIIALLLLFVSLLADFYLYPEFPFFFTGSWIKG